MYTLCLLIATLVFSTSARVAEPPRGVAIVERVRSELRSVLERKGDSATVVHGSMPHLEIAHSNIPSSIGLRQMQRMER